MESYAHWGQGGREGGVREDVRKSDGHIPETLSAVVSAGQLGSYSKRSGESGLDALARTDSRMSYLSADDFQ